MSHIGLLEARTECTVGGPSPCYGIAPPNEFPCTRARPSNLLDGGSAALFHCRMAKSYHPAMMVALLLYAYSRGVYSVSVLARGGNSAVTARCRSPALISRG